MMMEMYKKKYKLIRKLVWSFGFLLTLWLVAASCASPQSVLTAVAGTREPDSSAEIEDHQPDGTDRGGDGMAESPDGDRIAARTRSNRFVPIPPEVVPHEVVPYEKGRDPTIEAILASMTVEEKIGQLLMPAFQYDRNNLPVRGVTAELRQLLEDVAPGGFLLFAANIESPGQLRSFIGEMQAASRIPLIIAVDQEGGIVRRLIPTDDMPVTSIPAASLVGRAGDADLAYELAVVMAGELRSLGITMNLAPVADVLTNPDNAVIGNRAYGVDPEVVSVMVESTVRGLQYGGVSATLKHFPGHGDTVEDSHVEMAVLPHGLERLDRIEFEPFRRGIAAGSDAVLIGHISVPALTGDYTPATLSPLVTKGLLRQHLGFGGLIITDALTMAALTTYYSAEEIPLRALNAGADVLLRPEDAGRALRTILEALENGEVSLDRIDQSVRRVLEVKIRRGLIERIEAAERDDSAWTVVYSSPEGLPLFSRQREFPSAEMSLGIPEHRAVVDEILRRSAH